MTGVITEASDVSGLDIPASAQVRRVRSGAVGASGNWLIMAGGLVIGGVRAAVAR